MFSENVDNFRVSASPDFSVSSLPAAVACFSEGCKPSWQEEGNLWVIGGLENDTRANQFDPEKNYAGQQALPHIHCILYIENIETLHTSCT